jgi:hypothetical protein
LNDELFLGSRRADIERTITRVPALAELFLPGPGDDTVPRLLQLLDLGPEPLRLSAARELVALGRTGSLRLDVNLLLEGSSQQAFANRLQLVPELLDLFPPGTGALLAAFRSPNPRAAFRAAAERYPDHPGLAVLETRVADAEGRPAADLAREGKLEVRVGGQQITHVAVTLTNKVSHRLRVQLPAGSYFAASSSRVQNMMATRDATVIVEAGRSVTVTISAACVNIARAIPRAQDSLTLAGSATDESLHALARLLANRRVTSSVAQAAVWVLTDNASYDRLGILKRGRARVIGASELTAALKLLAEIDVDIRQRRVWADVPRIIGMLPGGELKIWLENQARSS